MSSTWIGNSNVNNNNTPNASTSIFTVVETTNNGSFNILSSHQDIIVGGLTDTFTLNLPDITILPDGKFFNILSENLNVIEIVDAQQTVIHRLEPYNKVTLIAIQSIIWIIDNVRPDSSKMQGFYDDLINGTSSGINNWVSTNSGTGAATGAATAEGTKNGIALISTGTTTTGRASCSKNVSTVILGTKPTIYETICRFYTLSTVAEEYAFNIGLGDNTGTSINHVDGVYFEYNRLVNGSNVWALVTSNNSIRTRVLTNVAIDNTSNYKLKAEINADGSNVIFFINDIEVGQINTNIPTANTRVSGPQFKIIKLAGSGSRSAGVDSFELRTYSKWQ